MLALAAGLVGLAAALLQAPTLLLKLALVLPALGLLSLWWMFRRVDGELRSVLPEFHSVRQEALALRPILRFTFDAMSDQRVMYGEAEACRLRHDILGPLNIASGFLELLSAELDTGDSLASEYLTRARDGVSRAIAIAVNIGTAPAEAHAQADDARPGESQGSTALRSGGGTMEGNT
ncbi:hypothetical protein [Paludibaculum fermentans]|uniref:hypothetical protein n=1 Tax=Paludibaculum fermentans TaxID=1473598 RepID=UPI003EB707B4